jgi:uncharacterized membrane protein YeaQ/YmgE (transglycosylase-associated protein family)
MSARLQPAFWGGLFIGVLSALPIVKFGNGCCCLWVVAGGVLAAWLAQSNQPQPLRAADGALLGLLAGVIGAVIATPIGLLFADWERGLLLRFIDSSNAEIPSEFRDMLENSAAGVMGQLLGFVVNLVLFAIFGVLGGLLGAAMFKKSAPPPPPGTVEILPPQ